MLNKIFFGDNLTILQSMPSESIDLIYIDPPFNTKKIQKRTTIKTIKDLDGDRRGFKGDIYRTVELGTKSYNDSFDSYINGFLRPRLLEAHRILKPQGSLYFHIDYREVHYCKILLDEIFGRDSFLNEIIWAYDYGGRAKSKWPAKHDNILFYVKNPKSYFFNRDEIDKEPYMAPGLVGPEKAEQGKMPTDTWWAMYSGTDKPRSPSDTWWIHFAKNKNQTDVWVINKPQPKGQNDTWWQTIIPTGSKERIGYPTQKPRKLIDRIIKASSNEGNVVLDFFAGSGTVGESCLELGRNFILIDNNISALEVMAKRFHNVSNKIEWINFDPNPYQGKSNNLEIIIPRPEKRTLSGDFVMLAAIANYLVDDLEEDSDLWKNSPFEWILKLPPGKKGKLGSNLVESWLTSKGIQIEATKNPTKVLIINGFRFVTKFSTLWENSSYKFQQIRASGYDYVICLGISPFDAHCWIFDRNYIIDHAKPQHKGARIADYWIEITPNQPEEWTKGYGGTLDNAYRSLKRIRKK